MKSNRQQKFLELYQPVHARFEKFCRARAYGDMPCEDLVNETLLVAFAKFENIKNEKAFLSFLIGTAIKLLANANRKMKPQSGIEDYHSAKAADLSQELDRKFEVDMLYRALAQLPESQREALILFEITGYSIKEIMEIQSSGESSVKQRLRRGRQALKEIISEQMNSSQLSRNGGMRAPRE